jgi:murein DD-endopeptidase MepM/ murein hydrolase activator NlpD
MSEGPSSEVEGYEETPEGLKGRRSILGRLVEREHARDASSDDWEQPAEDKEVDQPARGLAEELETFAREQLAAIEQEQARVARLLASLQERAKSLTRRERVLIDRQERLRSTEAELEQRLRSTEAELEQRVRRQAESAAEQARRVEAAVAALAEREQVFAVKAREHAERYASAEAREEELARAGEKAAAHERSLAAQAEALATREQELGKQREGAAELERRLAERERSSQARETELSRRSAEIAAEEKRLAQLGEQQALRMRELEREAEQTAARRKELEQRAKGIAARELLARRVERPEPVTGGAPGRRFNIEWLERLVARRREEFPDQVAAEWDVYLFELRTQATPDGALPESVTGLIEDIFAPIL